MVLSRPCVTSIADDPGADFSAADLGTPFVWGSKAPACHGNIAPSPGEKTAVGEKTQAPLRASRYDLFQPRREAVDGLKVLFVAIGNQFFGAFGGRPFRQFGAIFNVAHYRHSRAARRAHHFDL